MREHIEQTHGPGGPHGHHGHHGPRGHFGPPRERGRGPDPREFFGGEGPGGRHGRGPFGRRGGWGNFGGPGGPGGRERLERGVLRYVILGLLSDAPKHGYEIIKLLEERTGGRYSPSPGTLYPTLQYLEDLGLVSSDQADGRRVYQLTDAGRAEHAEHAEHAEGFWSRFRDRVPSGPVMHEVNFLKDALNDLSRTVSGGLRAGLVSGDAETLRKVRQVLESCQNEIRGILSQGAPAHATSGPAETESRGEGDSENSGPQETRSL